MNKGRIILQLETGYMDGIYSMDYAEVDLIRKRWDERFPESTHYILAVEDNDFNLPDNKFLPRMRNLTLDEAFTILESGEA